MDFEALGTQWHIESAQPIQESLCSQIFQTLDSIDQTWSRFRADSTVSQMAHVGGSHSLSLEELQLINFYHRLYQTTNGLVTPLIGQTMVDAGYDAYYSLKPKPAIAKPPAWDEVIEFNSKLLTLKQPALLDVGAAGKGWAVDRVASLLKPHLQSFTIDAGGDIFVFQQEQTIGLEHPDDPEQIIGTVRLVTGSICASASNRRAWGEWHHIINPQTVKPVDQVKATWVIAPAALQADGLATALFFVSPDKLDQFQPFSYVIVSGPGVNYSQSPDIVVFT